MARPHLTDSLAAPAAARRICAESGVAERRQVVIRLTPGFAASKLTFVLSDLWPTYALRIRTPRLTLRLPDENELAALAEVAATGIHKADERPFLTPWTEGGPEDRARIVLQSHWDDLGSWSPGNWTLGLAVFGSGSQPIGMATLRARDFEVVREVTTSSWLGLAHHGQGLGTEARAGLLTLAFDHLGATDATSEVFPDNHASQGVSRKLGYVSDGISRDARDDEVLVSDRLRLTAARWAEISHPPATVDGVEQARAMFVGHW